MMPLQAVERLPSWASAFAWPGFGAAGPSPISPARRVSTETLTALELGKPGTAVGVCVTVLWTLGP
ncbi:MAG: hypothetical protein IPG64_21320 [Haliea sp.]|nr:hypothetical protein [Haliea sp.]